MRHIKLLNFASVLVVFATLPIKTLAAGKGAPACLNSEKFRKMLKNKDTGKFVGRSCHWIRFKEHRRQFHCQDPDVFANCPQVCGACCDDNPSYTFLNAIDRRVSCDWITRNSKRITDRRYNYCEIPEIFENDVNIRDACAKSCNFCFALVTPFPTISPGPSMSPRPTRSPTKNPTNRPTKNPTKDPTKNPTDFPTKSPTKNPTDFPTKNPTKNPTDFPTKSPSARPTHIPSMFPSIKPSDQPSMHPNGGCIDDPDFTFKMDFNDFPVKCEWLTLSNKKKRQEKYCNRAEIKSACKQACDFCTCEDNAQFTFNLYKTGKEQKCEWIMANKKFCKLRRAMYCYSDATLALGSDLADECTKSCGFCVE